MLLLQSHIYLSNSKIENKTTPVVKLYKPMNTAFGCLNHKSHNLGHFERKLKNKLHKVKKTSEY